MASVHNADVEPPNAAEMTYNGLAQKETKPKRRLRTKPKHSLSLAADDGKAENTRVVDYEEAVVAKTAAASRANKKNDTSQDNPDGLPEFRSRRSRKRQPAASQATQERNLPQSIGEVNATNVKKEPKLGDDFDPVFAQLRAALEDSKISPPSPPVKPCDSTESLLDKKKTIVGRRVPKTTVDPSVEDKPAKRTQPYQNGSTALYSQSKDKLNGTQCQRGPHGRILREEIQEGALKSPAIAVSQVITPSSGTDTLWRQTQFAPSPSQPATNYRRSEKRPTTHTSESATPQQNRTSFYDEYINPKEALIGVASGTLYKGSLRINKRARRDAWVTVEGREDILIEGEKLRNRALDGDIVIVELIVVLEAEVLRTSSVANRNSEDREWEDITDQADDVTPKVDIVKNLDSDSGLPGKAKGKVVHILEKRPLQCIAGFIRPPGFQKGQKVQNFSNLTKAGGEHKFCMFHPQDARIPYLQIPIVDLPESLRGSNVIFSIQQKQNTIYAARLQHWGRYSRFPRGTITEELGQVGNIDAETAAILVDCDVDSRDFPRDALDCLPSTPWSISEEEIAKRRDFRRDRVTTIDPETARDLDDAVSCKRLPNGNFEVGVHIADVSHFLQQDSKLDQVAQSRATTVYLVQKAIPMLPRLLCEELCSLNPAVDRLTFSVVWQMNAHGKEVGPRWFGRSIIRSAVRFSYGEAQNLIDGKSWEEGVKKSIDGGHSEEEITEDIKNLLMISKCLRAGRFDNGALTINSFKLRFSLDSSGLPAVCEVYELKDANRLIEEFMLLANISVAEKIVESFPKHALLRMHPPPKDKPLADFVQYAAKLGINIDATDSMTLQQGFNDLAELARTSPIVGVLQNNAVRSMRRAEYICTGLHQKPDSWRHYALAVAVYTHFTSPIRRYADVVVHRLLDRAIKMTEPGVEPDRCEAWAKNCNVRKENSRNAQDRSSLLYLCAYIEEHCTQSNKTGVDEGMEMDAIIIAIRGHTVPLHTVTYSLDRSIDIIVPAMALEQRIYYEDSLGVKSFVYDESSEKTTVMWRNTQERLAAIETQVQESSSKEVDFEAGEKSTETGAPRGPSDVSAKVDKSSESEAQQVTKLSSDVSRSIRAPSVIGVMDTVKVWLRGDFSNSPCRVNAGLMMPYDE